MTHAPETSPAAAGLRMPRPLLLALLGVAAVLVTGAVYLIAVRGTALLIDLSAMARTVFCF